MNLINRRNNLLVLRGVFLCDFAEPPPAAARPESKPEAVYTVMPSRFTGVASWPTRSNLRCWSCDRMPNGPPAFIALDPERNSAGQLCCDVFGHYCRWNCAARDISVRIPTNQRPDALYNLTLIEAEFTGRRRLKIPPAPDKIEMKAYCGDRGLTTAQWDERVEALNAEHELTQYQMLNLTGAAAV